MIAETLRRLVHKTGGVRWLSSRRLRFIDRLLGHQLLGSHSSPFRILDIGCHLGKDFVRFFDKRTDLDLTGIDVQDYGLRQDNFQMILADAARLPFPDASFDLTVSIGTLEHIEPMEHLAMAIQEIRRVSKSYMILLPCLRSLIEPHTGQILWHLRQPGTKKTFSHPLLYMSEESWLAFQGFSGARCVRFAHIPLLVANLAIFRL